MAIITTAAVTIRTLRGILPKSKKVLDQFAFLDKYKTVTARIEKC